MVSGKVDSQILFAARSEKPNNLFGARSEKRKYLFGAKWQLGKMYLAVKGLTDIFKSNIIPKLNLENESQGKKVEK